MTNNNGLFIYRLCFDVFFFIPHDNRKVIGFDVSATQAMVELIFFLLTCDKHFWFFLQSKSPQTTKFDRLADQHALMLASDCRCYHYLQAICRTFKILCPLL